jgi:hypothetical protein
LALAPLPSSLAATREALHLVADRVVAAARKPDNEIALTVTPGGFGTPPFEFEGRTLQVTVDGAELVVAEDGAERRTAITNLADAAIFVGEGLYPSGAPDDRAPLGVDPAAARALGGLYAFAAGALERFARRLPAEAEATEVILWPEHFDVALEAGAEPDRATYGVSPGDEEHAEPYAYVSVWSGEAEGVLWNAHGFPGAELGYTELLAAADPQAAAVEFFSERHRALAERR